MFTLAKNWVLKGVICMLPFQQQNNKPQCLKGGRKRGRKEERESGEEREKEREEETVDINDGKCALVKGVGILYN